MEIAIPDSKPAETVTRLYGPGRKLMDWLPGWIERAVQMLTVMGLAVLTYYAITHYFFESVEVQGQSMYPTLHNADHYFLNRWAYHTHAPQRGDVVVVRDPSDGTLVVKRIIAMAGESIGIKNGDVFVNGVMLKEPYLQAGTSTHTPVRGDAELILCGKDQYFVMGDNRGNSFDSRYYGPVSRQNILGLITP